FQFAFGKLPVVLRDVNTWSCEKLESIVTAEIAYMEEGHFRAENRCASFHVGGHADTRWGKVDREENLLNHMIMPARQATPTCAETALAKHTTREVPRRPVLSERL